jgi:hypothetical protein
MTMALLKETLQTSETVVNLYKSTRRYNPEYSHPHGNKSLGSVEEGRFLEKMSDY